MSDAMTELQEAIAKLRHVTPVSDPWNVEDFSEGIDPSLNSVGAALAVVTNAALSGALVPASDAQLATALVVQKAADGAFRATLRHEGETPASPPWYEEFWAVRRDAILALADSDALAELNALRAQEGEG